MPNAGFPERVEGRFYYPSSPEYFARQTPLFLEQGARLVGGCCGTTPMHIRAMRTALDDYLQRPGRAQPRRRRGRGRRSAAARQSGLWRAGGRTADRAPAQAARRQVRHQRRGGSAARLQRAEADRGRPPCLEGGRRCRQRGRQPDGARAHERALACVQIQQQVDIETIVHFTTRDRSLMGLQADLIGARALGVRNILALTGDPPSLGDNQQSTPVYDVDSIGLVRIIDRFNQGLDLAGQEMGQKGRLHDCRRLRPDARRPGARGRPLPPQGQRRRALHDDAADFRRHSCGRISCASTRNATAASRCRC